jgi:hypothetical protein
VDVLQDEPVEGRRGRRRTEQLMQVDPHRLSVCPGRQRRLAGALGFALTAIQEGLVRGLRTGACSGVLDSSSLMSCDPVWRAACFAGRKLPG